MAIGVTAVVMIVSGLRRMWRSDRLVRVGGVADGVGWSSSRPRCRWLSWPTMARKMSSRVGCFSTYSTSAGGSSGLELGEGAVGDDPALVQDRDPVGEVLGLVEVLRREQHRGALAGERPGRSSTPRAATAGRARSSARRGRARAGRRSGSSRCRGGGACRRSRSPPVRPAASVSANRASRSSAIRPGSGRCRSWATSTRFSRPVRISSTAANWPVRLIDSRTCAGCGGDVVPVDARRCRRRPSAAWTGSSPPSSCRRRWSRAGRRWCRRGRSGRRP